jgi:hypothetical protein
VGYIRHGSGVETKLNYEDELLPRQRTTFAPIDFTARGIPAGTINLGLLYHNAMATNRYAQFRELGGTVMNTGYKIERLQPRMHYAALSENLIAEYKLERDTVKGVIAWWEVPADVEPPPVPEITNTPATTNPAAADYGETMTADDGTEPYVWTLPTAPDGATIDSATGVIRWVPAVDQIGGVYDFTALVTDALDATDTLAWQVTVTDVQLTGLTEMDSALGGTVDVDAALGGDVEM